jgi:NAD(P)H-dependent FMN reductase
VKIAFDHLFYEWKGKPALVVSYGGRGGGRANAGLREVLKGLRAAPMEKGVELSISGDKGEGMKAAEKEGRLVDTVKEGWKMDRKEEEVVDAVRELVALISKEG